MIPGIRHSTHCPTVIIPSLHRTKDRWFATQTGNDDGESDQAKQEHELVKLKRKMTNFYNKGNYKSALDYALKMEKATEDAFGTDNAVYASTVNNVALMV